MKYKITIAQVKGWKRGVKKFLTHSKTRTEYLVWQGLLELLILLELALDQKRDITRRIEHLNGAFILALDIFREYFGINSEQFKFLLGISVKINEVL